VERCTGSDEADKRCAVAFLRPFWLFSRRSGRIGSAATKSEILNPKSETNSKSKCPKPRGGKTPKRWDRGCCFEPWVFEFWVCFGFRASDFGFEDARTVHASDKPKPQRGQAATKGLRRTEFKIGGQTF
jgi:hypothetical protein